MRRPVFVDTTPATLNVTAPSHVANTVATTNLSISVQDNFDQIRVYVNDDEVKFNAGMSSWSKATPYDKPLIQK
ncbi:hypothetical protein ACOI1C_10450 [Bacillus sp. DJP31]|uniref:hypothetical protein n=1 Tax=Bacillus sp. DJP31 TaxID=3409789 RepID=UPI003BB7E936